MYKYSVAVPAIPYLSFNIAKIIKSLCGKNKKVLNLDMDNTLWGGIIGDDGVENIEIGHETALSQSYSEFQHYLKLLKDQGILLTVNSKNEKSNAIKGLERPDSVLREKDFVCIKANWSPKSENLLETASELNLLPESFVFVDDNPAERAIVEQNISGVAVPYISTIESYIQHIDHSGYFEVTTLSKDDLNRNKMYLENQQRLELKNSCKNYRDYLISLEMKAEIAAFSSMYFSRITQLTNKSNQFNLTTKRYTQSEIESVASNPEYITLYGKLKDKFGDNGVVSLVIGRIHNTDELHIDLWLMSCRVLKRDMENAMLDELCRKCKKAGIKKILGYYFPTQKNEMVRSFYGNMGFTKISEDADKNTTWILDISEDYKNRNNVISLELGD